jgi:hypothetical protein
MILCCSFLCVIGNLFLCFILLMETNKSYSWWLCEIIKVELVLRWVQIFIQHSCCFSICNIIHCSYAEDYYVVRLIIFNTTIMNYWLWALMVQVLRCSSSINFNVKMSRQTKVEISLYLHVKKFKTNVLQIAYNTLFEFK